MKRILLTISKNGEKYSVNINKATLNKIKLDDKSQLELDLTTKSWSIVPANNKKKVTHKKTAKKDISKIADSILDKYEPAFKKLSKT